MKTVDDRLNCMVVRFLFFADSAIYFLRFLHAQYNFRPSSQNPLHYNITYYSQKLF